MIENRIEYQKACYDLCSYLLKDLACPIVSPKRVEYLEKIDCHFSNEDLTFYLNGSYLGNKTKLK